MKPTNNRAVAYVRVSTSIANLIHNEMGRAFFCSGEELK